MRGGNRSWGINNIAPFTVALLGLMPKAATAQTVACCLADGECVDVPYAECVALGGDPHGPESSCAAGADLCDPYKWAQPPVPADPDNVYYGWNERSDWWFGPMVADDWLCETPEPVTDVHWWGSYLGWDYSEPPYLPDHFHIQFWTDVQPEPGGPYGFSHPGYLLHEVFCYNYTWEFVGWDFDPRGETYEACFKFEQTLYPEEWFWQDPFGEPTIYWISISACQGPPGSGDCCISHSYAGCQDPSCEASVCADDPYCCDVMWDQYCADLAAMDPNCDCATQPIEYPWGWKTRPRFFGDDAVVVLLPLHPVIGEEFVDGLPLWWPTEEESWDMAFELTTHPTEPYKWEQLPDLNPTGIDVDASGGEVLPPYVLADDYLCTATGSIREITVWGSWLWDTLPAGDPSNVMFLLSLHTDIPAEDSPTGYSMPGMPGRRPLDARVLSGRVRCRDRGRGSRRRLADSARPLRAIRGHDLLEVHVPSAAR
jgi:hypothetical protein